MVNHGFDSTDMEADEDIPIVEEPASSKHVSEIHEGCLRFMKDN